MNILVTGGSGTFGHYILRELLSHGHEVTDFSLAEPLVEGVEFIQGDVREGDRFSEAACGREAIVHLAGIAGPARATTEQLIHTNVVGMVHVLEAALRKKIQTIVFASSRVAFGFGFQRHEIVPCYLPIDEDHPAEPQDEYGLSKLLAEQVCKRYSDAFGLRTICLRLCDCWCLDREGAAVTVGSGWASGMSVEELWEFRYEKMIEDSQEHWPIPGPPSPYKSLWSVVDARDAATAFRLSVENDSVKHEVLVISGDETFSEVKTQELVARHYPEVPLREPLEGHASLLSYRRAEKILGFRPRFKWRGTDFQNWRKATGRISRQ